MFGKKLPVAKFPKPPALKVTKAPTSVEPDGDEMPATHPVAHLAGPPKRLAAQDPQILEKALLKRSKRFGN